MGEKDLGQQFMGKVIDEGYADLVKPSAEVIGQGLATVFKAVMYYPRLWGAKLDLNLNASIEDFQQRVKQNYEKIPEENRQLPSPKIVMPLMQALESSIYDKELRDLFAALLAASMDKESKVHPEFVDFVRRMDSKEAEFLRDCFRQDSSGTTEFGPIYFCFVNFGLRSSGLKAHVFKLQSAENFLLTMIPRNDGPDMTGHTVNNMTVMMNNVYAQNRMEYLLYPVKVKDRDVEVMIDHLITLGILEYASDVYQNLGLFQQIVNDEGQGLITASLPEDFLHGRELVSMQENSGPLSRQGDHVFEYELSVIYQVLQPTKFGLRFLQLCMGDGSDE